MLLGELRLYHMLINIIIIKKLLTLLNSSDTERSSNLWQVPLGTPHLVLVLHGLPGGSLVPSRQGLSCPGALPQLWGQGSGSCSFHNKAFKPYVLDWKIEICILFFFFPQLFQYWFLTSTICFLVLIPEKIREHLDLPCLLCMHKSQLEHNYTHRNRQSVLIYKKTPRSSKNTIVKALMIIANTFMYQSNISSCVSNISFVSLHSLEKFTYAINPIINVGIKIESSPKLPRWWWANVWQESGEAESDLPITSLKWKE